MNLNKDSDPKDIIRAVREKLAKPENWIKGHNTNPEGAGCLAYTILNLTGLLNAESSIVAERSLIAVSKALGFTTPGLLVDFNDAPSTTHEVLLARLDAALT